MHWQFFLSAVVATAFVLPEVHLQAEPWPQFRGPHRDSISHEKGIFQSVEASEPKLKWIAEGVGTGYASVAVVNGRLYTSGIKDETQHVTAISIQDGTVIWSSPITSANAKLLDDGSRSTPTVDGENLYAVSSNGAIHCLSTIDGKSIWSRSFNDWGGKTMGDWGFSESPLIDGEYVLCTPGGKKGILVALDKKTGKDKWACEIDDSRHDTKPLNDGAGYASIVLSNAGGVKQYVQLVGKGVIGVRAEDGKLLWRYTGVANAKANTPTVISLDNEIFCSTGYDTGSALLRFKAIGKDNVVLKEVYFLSPRKLQNQQGGMVLFDGYIYCGHGNGDGLPICVEMKTGKVAWGPLIGSGQGEASVVYADGYVVFRYQDGIVSFVKATPEKYTHVRSFKPLFKEKESWAAPAISDGCLYLREQDKVLCYRFD